MTVFVKHIIADVVHPHMKRVPLNLAGRQPFAELLRILGCNRPKIILLSYIKLQEG
jgi:hypothetical protein